MSFRKNVTNQEYKNFVKNGLVDIFSQKPIKNIPRNRLVMLDRTPFNSLQLDEYFKQRGLTHPMYPQFNVSPNVRAQVREKANIIKYKSLPMLRRFFDASLQSSITEPEFLMALRQAGFENQQLKPFARARSSIKSKKVSVGNLLNRIQFKNFKRVFSDVDPDSISEATKILLSNAQARQKEKNRIESMKKAAKNQGMQHKDLLQQQRRKTVRQQIRNLAAFKRVAAIARNLRTRLAKRPLESRKRKGKLLKKVTARLQGLGFSITWIMNNNKKNMRYIEQIVMEWFSPGTNGNTKTVRVPIDHWVYSDYGFTHRSQIPPNTDMQTYWIVPVMKELAPGSRTSVQKMTLGVLHLLGDNAITRSNLNNRRRRQGNFDNAPTSPAYTRIVTSPAYMSSNNNYAPTSPAYTRITSPAYINNAPTSPAYMSTNSNNNNVPAYTVDAPSPPTTIRQFFKPDMTHNAVESPAKALRHIIRQLQDRDAAARVNISDIMLYVIELRDERTVIVSTPPIFISDIQNVRPNTILPASLTWNSRAWGGDRHIKIVGDFIKGTTNQGFMFTLTFSPRRWYRVNIFESQPAYTR